jgi:hypothetical protein
MTSTPIDPRQAEIYALFNESTNPMKMVPMSKEQMEMLNALPDDEQKAFLLKIIKEGTRE